jgi:hypothetical protein
MLGRGYPTVMAKGRPVWAGVGRRSIEKECENMMKKTGSLRG